MGTGENILKILNSLLIFGIFPKISPLSKNAKVTTKFERKKAFFKPFKSLKWSEFHGLSFLSHKKAKKCCQKCQNV